ncbi:MAG: hypothetical protein KAS57_03050 [Gammaproteobacteria bacterium]|nr:hypothetical protein [Gammaproteobacteria bacterium]
MKKSNITVTIEDGLKALDSLLILSVQQRSVVSVCQSEIDKVVIAGFAAQATSLPGAFYRHTTIQPLEDNEIDLFVQLSSELGQRNTPGGLLGKLEDLLVEYYPEARLSVDKQAVLVKFAEVSFRVTPCFYQDKKGYVIADGKNDKWLKTDPSIFYYALDDANNRHKGLLLPVIRIIKHWNRRNGNWFNDYYLELMVKHALDGVKFDSYVQAIKYVFKKAIRLVVFTIDDPSNFGKQMEGLKDVFKMVEAMLSFQDCHGHIVKAEHFEKRGDLISAYKEWGKIFADDFPSYVDIMAEKLEANGISGVEALQIMRDAT